MTRLLVLLAVMWFAGPALGQTDRPDQAGEIAALLNALDDQLRLEQKGEQVDQVKARRAQLQSELGERASPAGFPMLVRVVGVGNGKLIAQFSHGDTLFEAREGEPITSTHRLRRITLNAVELAGPSGAREVLMLGSARPSPGQLVAPERATSVSAAAQGRAAVPADLARPTNPQ